MSTITSFLRSIVKGSTISWLHLNYTCNPLTDSGTGKGSGYNSIIPDAPGAESHPLTKALGEKIGNYVDQYVEAMEKVSDSNGIQYYSGALLSSSKKGIKNLFGNWNRSS